MPDDAPGRAPTARVPSVVRVASAALVGAGTALAVARTPQPEFALLSGWVACCVVFLVWTWCVIGPMDAVATRSHATREEPTRTVAHLVVLVAAVASVGAVGTLLLATRSQDQLVRFGSAALAMGGVLASWAVIHTLYTLRYAYLYYIEDPGGIDFNQESPPRYADFAYVAFVLGMTYQVADTNIGDSRIRVTALCQALLSYLFGAVVLAAAINLVVVLGS